MNFSKQINNVSVPVVSEGKRYLWLVFLFALLVGNVYFAFGYFALEKQIEIAYANSSKITFNQKVLDFNKLFIDKVLKANSEIDFETRLKLESSVRELNDSQILEKWQAFIDSKNENQAQDNVKELLAILSEKVRK